MKNNEKGRSMIEMLGVLSVVGVLSMSAISLFSKALHQRKISVTVDQVADIMSNVRNACHGRRSCDNIIPETLTKGNDTKNIIPDDMWKSNGSINNAFGGDIKIQCVKSSSDEDAKCLKEFKILLSGLDKTACLKLVTSDWGDNVKVKIVNSTEIDNTKYSEDTGTERKITMANAKNNCDNNINILWTVK